MLTFESRPHPRISVNKLGEYLVSPPLRRHDILERQKYPLDLVASYYEPARRLLVDFLLGAIGRASVLGIVGTWTEGSTWSRPFDQRRARGCADAVLRFLADLPGLDFHGLRPVTVDLIPTLHLEGVTVSIKPDLMLRGVDARGRTTYGAVKLHFPKAHPVSEVSAQYVATLLKVHLREAFGRAVRIDPECCIAVDVFRGTKVTAPRADRRRLRDVAAACQEIRRVWPQVEPRAETPQ